MCLVNMALDYFETLNLREEAERFFFESNFDSGIPIVLSAGSNVQNRSVSSHQTQICPSNLFKPFFFTEEEIELSREEGIDWREHYVMLSMVNVRHVAQINRGENIVGNSLELVRSYTHISIERGSQHRLQLGLADDERIFYTLRDNLQQNDVLIFFHSGYEDVNDFVLAIPNHFAQLYNNLRREVYHNLSTRDLHVNGNRRDSHAADDGTYQDVVNSININQPLEQVDYSPVLFNDTSHRNNVSHRINTNPQLAAEVIARNSYDCFISREHHTFIKSDGHQYMEAHHLIPVSQQEYFEYALDTAANIVPLCPICHRLLHHGRIDDIRPVLRRLYEEHIEHLAQSGLEISFEQLLSYYL